jgi:lysozyme
MRGARGLLFLSLLTAGCTLDRQDDESIGEVEQEQVVCGVGPTVPGIDVSYYQGTIDWSKVAASGKRFAIARVAHPTFKDPQFDANWDGIKKAGMVRGAYLFFNSKYPQKEWADYTVQKVGKLGPGDLAPVLDVEATDGATPAQMVADIKEWIDVVEKGTGRKPIIYSGKYFWNDNVGSTAFNTHPLWHPQYTTASCPDIAAAWKNWAIWQYSSMGAVPGIVGNVDMNRLNGDELALQDLAANGWRATVVSLDYPAKLAAGTSGMVRLVLKNDGARSWDQKTVLGTSKERDRKSPFRAPSWPSDNRAIGIEGSVTSGQTATLQFSIVAPGMPGKYVEHFNLVEEGVAWFSDIVPGGGPSDDAIALSIEVTDAQPSTSAGVTGAGGSSADAVGVGGTDGIPNSHASGSCAASTQSDASSPSAATLAALALALGLTRRRRVAPDRKTRSRI